ncbi:MAG: dienelactone hydrolase family protein [Acidobacteriota bacterium]|nr:dienelactone hydrolase family protein [Acidobacteriota bacterium]
MSDKNLQTDRELKTEIKLYYDLFVPENVENPAPLLIALHGYGANKRYMMRETRTFAPDNFVIAALQGFHQHWREPMEKGVPPKIGFGWLTSYKAEDSVRVHQRALLDLTENLIREGITDENRIFMLGFSQSCALNFRLAFSHPELLRGVVGISGGIPGDWDENENYRKTEAQIFYLYGTRDEFYPLETFERNAEKLKSRAANYQSKVYDAAHEITDEMRRDLNRWLQEKEK